MEFSLAEVGEAIAAEVPDRTAIVWRGVRRSYGSLNDRTRRFANALIDEASRDDKIVAVTAAMPDGTGLDLFAKQYPNRCYSYSQFCDRYNHWRRLQKRSMRQQHKAGEKCFFECLMMLIVSFSFSHLPLFISFLAFPFFYKGEIQDCFKLAPLSGPCPWRIR